MSDINPSTQIQKPKISPAIWAGVAVACIVILSLISNAIKSNEAGKEAEEAANKVAGPNNPVVQRISRLNHSEAYSAGYNDGVREAADVAQRIEVRGKMHELAAAKNSFFDVIASIKSADAAVLSEYRRGWNSGWNAVRVH